MEPAPTMVGNKDLASALVPAALCWTVARVFAATTGGGLLTATGGGGGGDAVAIAGGTGGAISGAMTLVTGKTFVVGKTGGKMICGSGIGAGLASGIAATVATGFGSAGKMGNSTGHGGVFTANPMNLPFTARNTVRNGIF